MYSAIMHDRERTFCPERDPNSCTEAELNPEHHYAAEITSLYIEYTLNQFDVSSAGGRDQEPALFLVPLLYHTLS